MLRITGQICTEIKELIQSTRKKWENSRKAIKGLKTLKIWERRRTCCKQRLAHQKTNRIKNVEGKAVLPFLMKQKQMFLAEINTNFFEKNFPSSAQKIF